MSFESEKFEADREAGRKIAERYYSRDAAFNGAFGEGFAVAMTAIEATGKEIKDASAGD